MRFYTTTHNHCCEIDPHARNMHFCVLTQQGKVLLHRNLRTDPKRFLRAIASFRQDLLWVLGHVHLVLARSSVRSRKGPPRTRSALHMRAGLMRGPDPRNEVRAENDCSASVRQIPRRKAPGEDPPPDKQGPDKCHADRAGITLKRNPT